MTEETPKETTEQHEQSLLVPSFGLELLRDELIPELLGDEAGHILYWAGKSMARKYPLEDFDAIAAFFQKASWGDLSIIKEKKEELQLLLTGEFVNHRYEVENEPTFKLEAGFIAEQLQLQHNLYTESYDELDIRKRQAKIVVKWDRKEIVASE